jgi:hypothetical protein
MTDVDTELFAEAVRGFFFEMLVPAGTADKWTEEILAIAADHPPWLAEVGRLKALLEEANRAFDECTGPHAKELVHDEAWRMP